ncbi:hypothetical protein JCM8097_004528 [Rhodosporidiobolus ruineniae]
MRAPLFRAAPSPFPSSAAPLRSAAFRPRAPPSPLFPFASFARHSSSTASLGQTARDKLRARPYLLLVGLMPIFTLGLGIWQVKRLYWKLDLIDQLDNKLHQDPVRLPAKIDVAAIPEFAWRKVYVTGVFDHEHSIILGPKTRDGQIGYHVFTPLIRGEGQDTILVNRGFVKHDFKDPKTRPASLTNERVEIIGMLRDQEQRNSFTPVNQPDKEQWVFSDIAEIAAYTGAQPVLVDQIYDDHPGKVEIYLRQGVPVGRGATIELRNMHATYAATWFALSLATTFGFWQLMRRPKPITAAARRGIK